MQTNLTAFSEPGRPALHVDGAQHRFGNAAIALQWRVESERLHAFALVDRVHARTLRVAEPFTLRFADGRALRLADLTPVAPLRTELLAANPAAPRIAGTLAGVCVVAVLRDATDRLRVEWRVEQRDDSPYLRMHLAMTATVEALHVAAVSLLETEAPGARTTGTIA